MTAKRWVLRAAAGALVLWLGVLGVSCVSMRRFLYPAPRPPAPVVLDPGMELLRIDDPGHGTVHVLLAPAPAGARTVVHFHGNAEELATSVYMARRFVDAGLGFAAVEYPGYGPSSAQSPTETAVYRAAERALAHLARVRGIAREDTVLMGQSLGTGVAVEMASRGHGGRLVLISPFTSMVDVVQHFAPFLPASWIVPDRYESARKAPRVAIPVLLVHGADDALVPAAMSDVLARLFPRARRVVVPSRGHNDLWADPRDGVLTTVLEFARRPHGV